MVGFNLADILSQATKVKGEIQRIQEQAAKKTVEVTAGGGMIKVIVNGRQEIL